MDTSDQNSPPPTAGPKVFISYRHDPDRGYALALREVLLAKKFGADAVFLDVGRIGGGEKFLPKIQAALAACNTFLALIGPGWLGAAARLHDPDDFVRMEIAAALASGVNVIPVLLDGAQMPEKKVLPADIQELTSYQAEELRHTRWDDDVRNLIKAIRAPFAEPPRTNVIDRIRRAATWLPLSLLAVLLLATGFAVWRFALKPNGNTNSNSNGNGNAVTPTPVLTRTVEATPTPAQTPTPPAKCFREFLPEGRWVSIEYGYPDYRVVIRPDQPAEGQAGILFTENGRHIGAIRFTSAMSGGGQVIFRVEKVIGPNCRPAPNYENLSREGQKDVLLSYDYLGMWLDQRRYDLRLAYRGDQQTIVARFMDRTD